MQTASLISRVIAYGLAAAAVAATALLRFVLDPWVGQDMPLLLFLLPVIGAALYGGTGPALLATGLSLLVGDFLFVEPRGALGVLTLGERIRFAAFLVEGTLISLMAGSRVQALLARREADERFSLLAEAIPQLVWSAAPDGRLLYVNRRWIEYTGRGFADTVECWWRGTVHPDDAGGAAAAWERAVAEGVGHEHEFRLRRAADGVYRWHLARSIPVRDDQGRVVRWFGTITEIDDRRRTEGQLRSRLCQQAAVAELGRAALNGHDLQRLNDLAVRKVTECLDVPLAKVLELSDDGLRLRLVAGVGWPEGMVGTAEVSALDGDSQAVYTLHSRAPVIVADLAAETRFRAPALLRGQAVVSGMTVVIGSPERPLGAMGAHCRERRDFDEDDVHFLQSVANILAAAIDRRRGEAEREALLARQAAAQAEAEAANRAKDRFLAVLGHELRTPMNAILGWAQVLRNGEPAVEEIRHGLEVIERNVRAQTRIIADLLDVSRIVAGKLSLDRRPTDLAGVIDTAVESVLPTARERGVAVEWSAPSQRPVVVGDAGRLRQVVVNLLTNAVKFTPSAGRVRVELDGAACDAGRVCLTVSDTGPGLPADLLPHVFEPFRQGGGDDPGRHGGLGLGLAIVRQLTELHGGGVRAANRSDGPGAVFTVELPAVPEVPGVPAPEPPATPRAAAAFPRLDGLRVLVVDDHPDARALAAAVLERSGAQVQTAGSADEALRRLDDGPADVLVSDIAMPGGDGCELLRRVRDRPAERGGRVPAAALTAFVGAEDRRRIRAAGFQIHLAKPVEPVALADAVARLAGRQAG